VPDSFLRNLWPSLVVWGLVYISDYVLTIMGARLYRRGVNEVIVFEGSYELNPLFRKDVDSLRRVSPRFLAALLLSEVWLAGCWLLSAQSQAASYEFMFGILILAELTVHVRHLRNLYMFRTINSTGGVRGRIEYSRALLLRMASAEWLIFSGVFLLLFAFTRSWFILGGVVGCSFAAIKNLKLARKHRIRPAEAVQESQ
jgi:hypothetical protein